METDKRYIGITLGPIGRIMSYTQSTKSFWRASYFMSYLGKQLITDFFNEGRTFLKPQLNREMWTLHDGVGHFPDQYIFEAKEGDYQKILIKREEVLQLLGKSICTKLKNITNIGEAISYLKDTLKIYILQFTVSPDETNGKSLNSYIVDSCQQAMSVMECRDQYPLKRQRNYLAEYFESDILDDFLVKDAFGTTDSSAYTPGMHNDSYRGYRMFQSIIEITAQKALEEEIIHQRDIFKEQQVAELGAKYKYIAYVSADGDNVGKTIAKLGTDMSNLLWEYSKGLSALVEGFGGKVIYSGGDDLVLFAPAATIFQLINRINDHFESLLDSNRIDEKLKQYDRERQVMDPSPQPSLSFGVSISYYKFPMQESLAQAENLLDAAKHEGRNRIAWKLRKHSGQSIESRFNKDKEHAALYQEAIKMVEQEHPDEEFLHSFSHYLLQHQEILAHILSDETHAREWLDNYLNSTFEDAAHKSHASMLSTGKNYLLHLAEKEHDKAKAIQKLHALLRYIELFTLKQV